MATQHSYIGLMALGLVIVVGTLMLPTPAVAEEEPCPPEQEPCPPGGGTTDVNAGVEPGAGCEAALEDFECDVFFGAPMEGEATVEWDPVEGAAFFSGRLEELGPGGCVIDTDVIPGTSVEISSSDIPNKVVFDSLSAQDLRGFCIQNITVLSDGVRACRAVVDFGEVLSATRLMELDDFMFTVRVLALPLTCRRKTGQ